QNGQSSRSPAGKKRKETKEENQGNLKLDSGNIRLFAEQFTSSFISHSNPRFRRIKPSSRLGSENFNKSSPYIKVTPPPPPPPQQQENQKAEVNNNDEENSAGMSSLIDSRAASLVAPTPSSRSPIKEPNPNLSSSPRRHSSKKDETIKNDNENSMSSPSVPESKLFHDNEQDFQLTNK
ncbi:hypothetical protein M9Y10_023442, partial [Tritrichomonas musculus]